MDDDRIRQLAAEVKEFISLEAEPLDPEHVELLSREVPADTILFLSENVPCPGPAIGIRLLRIKEDLLEHLMEIPSDEVRSDLVVYLKALTVITNIWLTQQEVVIETLQRLIGPRD